MVCQLSVLQKLTILEDDLEHDDCLKTEDKPRTNYEHVIYGFYRNSFKNNLQTQIWKN